MSPTLITTPEAARILFKSTRSIHRMVDAGTLKPIRQLPGPNGAFLFDRAEVEAIAKAAA